MSSFVLCRMSAARGSCSGSFCTKRKRRSAAAKPFQQHPANATKARLRRGGLLRSLLRQCQASRSPLPGRPPDGVRGPQARRRSLSCGPTWSRTWTTCPHCERASTRGHRSGSLLQQQRTCVACGEESNFITGRQINSTARYLPIRPTLSQGGSAERPWRNASAYTASGVARARIEPNACTARASLQGPLSTTAILAPQGRPLGPTIARRLPNNHIPTEPHSTRTGCHFWARFPRLPRAVSFGLSFARMRALVQRRALRKEQDSLPVRPCRLPLVPRVAGGARDRWCRKARVVAANIEWPKREKGRPCRQVAMATASHNMHPHGWYPRKKRRAAAVPRSLLAGLAKGAHVHSQCGHSPATMVAHWRGCWLSRAPSTES